MVVVGGFASKTMEEAETMLADLMKHVQGFKELEVTTSDPPIGLVHFETPAQTMKFIRGQRKNPTMTDNKLWASENRSKSERMRCKTASKLKKFLIELGGFVPKDVVVSYKVFKVNVRVDGRLMQVAALNTSCEVRWFNEDLVNQEVREAMDTFMEDLE